MKKLLMMGSRLGLAISMAILSAGATAAEFVMNDSGTAPQIFGAKVFKGDEIALFDLSREFGRMRDYVAYMDTWVMLPIRLSSAKEKVAPVLVYGSASDKDIAVSVMTDAAVRKLFYQDRHDEEWTDDGLNGSRMVRGIEKSGTWYEWPKGYWEDGSDPLRAWIVVKPKDAKGRRSFLPTYRVGLAGTDEVSPVITIYEDGAQSQKADALFGGKLKFAGLRSGEIMADGECLDGRYCLELASSGLKITVPSAGRLVLKGMDFDFGWYGRWYEDDLWIGADENGSEKGYQMFPSGNFGEIDIYAMGRFISECPTVSKDGTVEIVCSDKTTVIVRGWRWLEWGDSDTEEFVDEMYLKGVAFYPASSPSAVAVTTSALATRVSPKGEEIVMWPGTVTGAGSYAPGERVTLTATGLNGNVFDHWECDDSGVAFADARSSATTFAVPFGLSGPYPELAIRAVWKDVKDVFVRTSPLGAGTPAAYGRATVSGEVLPVTVKNVSKTQTLRSWSDGGEASLTRNYTVTTDAVQDLVAQYADFPKLSVVVKPGCEGMGSVNTAVNKGYPTGSKVSLKATAAKKHVFAGWYTDSSCEEPLAGTVDYRTPNLTYVTDGNDSTFYAKFIPVAEDWATVGCEIADEYVTKRAIEPITVAFDGGSLPTVKATGLPSGLKFTTKLVTSKVSTGTDKNRVTALVTNALPYQIYGTPTKSGIFNAKVTVTTAGKTTASANLVFTVLDRAKGERILRIEYDTLTGKTTGAGIYAAGKKVTLKATANAAKKATNTTPAQDATVFAGWYADPNFTMPLEGLVDFRTLSFPYVMPDVDATVWADFVPASEDTDIVLIIDGHEVTSDASGTVFNTSGGLTLALDVESVSVPKITVSGLPAGLNFTAKEVLNKDKAVIAEANTIYGTATKPGTYVVTAKLTNTTVKKTIEKKFTIVVDNLTGANDCFREPIANGRGEKYVISAGVMEYDNLPSLMLNCVGSLKVSGLPSGMKYNAGKSCLEGRVTKAGTYTVSLTVNGKTSTFTLEVQPLPEWVVGSFEMMMAEGNDLNGRFATTISSSGDITLKLSEADGNKVDSGAKKLKLLRRTADDEFYFEYNNAGSDQRGVWDEHFELTLRPCEVDGVVFGVIEGEGLSSGFDIESWGREYWEDVNQAFGVQNVWSRAAGTALCPEIANGTQVELDMSDWTERGWDYQDDNYDLDGCFLVLTYGKNGNMSVAFFENGAAKASATAGTVLVPYELSPDGKTLKALASVVFAPRGRHAISLALYFNLDVSHGAVYGSDFTLDHYYMENK